ncbi:pentatricopeptide repeat-containing protein At1g02150-like [Mangifera indica]|uniref:pentatricopeptide repeat-containing protein At1g02150-like n=1 Tax=Mangifera indica TaxID=29780 RepID=UPI001CFB5424|nr:pentatricopeptide repeat-containing protein At1g02150-like [Mangifera indica]
MFLQPSLHNHHNISLSSTLSYSQLLTCKVPPFTLLHAVEYQKLPIIRCSISQTHHYGTADFERRPMIKWNAIYKKISLMENPEMGCASVLNQWENGGRKVTKWELSRVIKELRKFRRYKQALEVCDWMNNRGERFRLSASDAAIQLDLIAKVHGISTAEDFFLRLPDTLKERRVYGALLNAYVRARMRENAEKLYDKLRDKGYAMHSLPFNVMMTLYMKLKKYDKVDSMVSEMMEKGVRLDVYSYNIWLSSYGSQGSAEKMEQVYEQMKMDRAVNPDWTTFSTMATMYIKMGQFEKAEECLRRVESRMNGQYRIPYHYLLSLYGGVGNKEEVYRVWKAYKSNFPSIPNLGYHAMILSLVKIGDIEGMENIYEEWLSVKSYYDPRIANLLLGCYINEGNFDKAETFFNHMVEVGGKPNSTMWEILAKWHIGEKRILDALSCLKEAFGAVGVKNWRPKPVNVLAFFKLCDEESNMVSKEVLVGLLRQSGYRKDKAYISMIGLTDETFNTNVLSEIDRTDYNNDSGEDEDQTLLSQLQSSL